MPERLEVSTALREAPMTEVPQIIDGVPLTEKQKAKLTDVLSVLHKPYEAHHEFINGHCFHFFFSEGPSLTIGPHGGLWWYLNAQQREVHPNFWDNGQPSLTIGKLVASLQHGAIPENNQTAGTIPRKRYSKPVTNSDPYNFSLQFPESEISDLVTERLKTVDQEGAFQAGRSIVSGNYVRENLNIIVAWKMADNVHLTPVMASLSQNTDAEIEQALQSVVTADGERSAIEALDKLHGVGVPVASALLTAIDPEKYTIIDVHALRSLGMSDTYIQKVDYYLAYLKKCRELAQQFKISLRTLDHALWQWGWIHRR
jgi:hypothetical protein